MDSKISNLPPFPKIALELFLLVGSSFMSMTLGPRGKSPRLVEVVFLDPTEAEFNSSTLEEPSRCSTVGWIRELGPTCVKIAWLNYDNEQDTAYGLILPRGCILSLRPILRAGSELDLPKTEGGPTT